MKWTIKKITINKIFPFPQIYIGVFSHSQETVHEMGVGLGLNCKNSKICFISNNYVTEILFYVNIFKEVSSPWDKPEFNFSSLSRHLVD